MNVNGGLIINNNYKEMCTYLYPSIKSMQVELFSQEWCTQLSILVSQCKPVKPVEESLVGIWIGICLES